MDDLPIGRHGGDFPADFLDVAVDGAVGHDALVAVHGVHQLVAGVDAAGVGGEHLEELILDRGQAEVLAAERSLEARVVQLAFLGGPSAGLAVAASVLQPIFDGGRLKGIVSIAESRERELVETYRKAILAAFADVETALAAAGRLARREALQVQVEERAREALRLAEVRYREGVALSRALGGGWRA